MASLRIAVGQISSESNHFVTSPCELDHFRNTGYLYEGDELFQLAEAGNEVAGFLATLRTTNDVQIVPLLAARGNSSGPLSKECYTYLREHLLEALRRARPVDGVLLSHHGSMAAVDEDDPEGDIAAAVREVIGPAAPIVMTLDLHGNVTARMVEAANAIIGYEHYPHDDTYTTGVRGANLLLRTLQDQIRPIMARAKLPMLLTAFHGSTAGSGPFATLMQQAKEFEAAPDILAVSLFFVGSYIDVPEIGCSTVVVSNGDRSRAVEIAKQLAERFWETRRVFQVETVSVAEAIRRGRKLPGGPILLLDTADTTGGGAAGDGAGLVKGLLAAGVTEPCLATVVDPDAAQACMRAGIGGEVTVRLGHKLDPKWGTPVEVSGRVSRISDGRFTYTGGILGGTSASMGWSVVLEIGSIKVLITSFPTYEWADEQYRSVGLQPDRAVLFVGVKNMMNFRHGYGQTMRGYFVLDLPGPTPPDMRMLPFARIARPVFPLDDDLRVPQIQIASSR